MTNLGHFLLHLESFIQKAALGLLLDSVDMVARVAIGAHLFPVFIHILVGHGRRAVVSFVGDKRALGRFVSIKISLRNARGLTLHIEVGLVSIAAWHRLGKELSLVHQATSWRILSVCSWNLDFAFVIVVSGPLHDLLSLDDVVCEAGSLLFVPLEALRVVLSRIVERLLEGVLSGAGSSAGRRLSLVNDVREERGLWLLIQAVVDLSVYFVQL